MPLYRYAVVPSYYCGRSKYCILLRYIFLRKLSSSRLKGVLPPFPPNFNVACAFELMPLRGWFCLCNIFSDRLGGTPNPRHPKNGNATRNQHWNWGWGGVHTQLRMKRNIVCSKSLVLKVCNNDSFHRRDAGHHLEWDRTKYNKNQRNCVCCTYVVCVLYACCMMLYVRCMLNTSKLPPKRPRKTTPAPSPTTTKTPLVCWTLQNWHQYAMQNYLSGGCAQLVYLYVLPPIFEKGRRRIALADRLSKIIRQAAWLL